METLKWPMHNGWVAERIQLVIRIPLAADDNNTKRLSLNNK